MLKRLARQARQARIAAVIQNVHVAVVSLNIMLSHHVGLRLTVRQARLKVELAFARETADEGGGKVGVACAS